MKLSKKLLHQFFISGLATATIAVLVAVTHTAVAGTVIVNGQPSPNAEVEHDDGLLIRRSDGKSSFTVNARVHADYTQYDGAFNLANLDRDSASASLSDPNVGEGRSSSNYDVSRARLTLGGHSGNWYFKLGYDFVNNGDRLFDFSNTAGLGTSATTGLLNDVPLASPRTRSGFTDVYAQYRIHDWAWLTFGRHKMPFSLDELTSSNDILFLERNVVAQALAIGRADGVSVRGGNNHFSYQFAVFLEDSEHLGQRNENDKNNLSTALRVAGFNVTDAGTSFHFGFSWAERNLSQAVATRSGTAPIPDVTAAVDALRQTELPRLYVNSEVPGATPLVIGAMAFDHVSTYGIELALAISPVFIKAEVASADYDEQQVRGTGGDIDAFSMEFGWVVTGETHPYDPVSGTFARIKPKRKWAGAWELVLRYSELDLDPDNAVRGLRNSRTNEVLPNLASQYRSLTYGFNWHASDDLRLSLNVVDATIRYNDADGVLQNPGNDEGDAYVMRVQYAF